MAGLISRTEPKSNDELLERINPRLESFTEACNAVAEAQQRGIIHRELKLANVMVGASGETIVVDWGLAAREAAIEQADQTIAGVEKEPLPGINPLEAHVNVGTELEY